MLLNFVTAVLTASFSMIVLTGLWLAVQRLWLNQFQDQAAGNDDSLANRSGCHNCNCARAQECRENSMLNETNTEAS